VTGESKIFGVDALDFRFTPGPWTFAEGSAAAIAKHWREQNALRPKMFDGRVLLCRSHEIVTETERRILRGHCFETDFSAFLAWRDFSFPDRNVRNCFAMAALQSADGAFMLGRMADHTANAGKVYFPAGTPDHGDIKGEIVDLEGSVLRELTEETGLGHADVVIEAGWTIILEGPRIACMQRLRARETASALQERLRAFNATEAEPELVALEPVFAIADIERYDMPEFMRLYLVDALNNAKG
jgi:8-oxo-dGTP pyrophosphatase MutT (NUDIX family)